MKGGVRGRPSEEAHERKLSLIIPADAPARASGWSPCKAYVELWPCFTPPKNAWEGGFVRTPTSNQPLSPNLTCLPLISSAPCSGPIC